MREEAEARAAAAEALLKRAESAPTQSPTPQQADDGPTQVMECVTTVCVCTCVCGVCYYVCIRVLYVYVCVRVSAL